MAANKPGKEAILAAFFDEGNYSPPFTDGAVSAAFGCANGQSVYAVYQNGEPVGAADLDKTTRVLKMADETGADKDIPEAYRWGSLTSRSGIDLKKHYYTLLSKLGEESVGRVAQIYANASSRYECKSNNHRKPANSHVPL